MAELERLSEDDLRARRDEEFRAHALASVTTATFQATRGTCLNCSNRIVESDIYCDADCRADYEARSAILARKGGR